MIVPLPVRDYKNGEEIFPIDHYFNDNNQYEVAIASFAAARNTKLRVASIKTNILEYDKFNPEQILLTFGATTQITTPVFYKVGVASLKNLRIRLVDFPPSPLAITLIFRIINGEEKV